MAKKIIGILLIFLGVAAFLFANYVANQVEEGKQKIKNTQKTVNQVKKISKVNPYSKAIGEIATQPVQEKINAGKEEVKQYSKLAKRLYVGSYISFGLGLLFLIFGFIYKKKKV